MRYLIGLLMLLFMPLSAEATNFFVKPTASGSGTGADWTNALGSTFTPARGSGNTYYLADGAYGTKTFSTSGSSPVINIKKCTTTDGVSSAAAGYVSTLCDGQATWGTITFGSSGWVFDGVTGGGPGQFTNTALFGFFATITTNDGLFFNGGISNITVRHYGVQGPNSANSSAAMELTGGGYSDITCSYCYFNGIGFIHFYVRSLTRFLIEYSYIGTFHFGQASHSEIMSGGDSNGAIFRYNIITHISSTGGLMYASLPTFNPGLEAYGNVFYKIPGSTAWEAANGIVGGWTGGNICGNTTDPGCEQFHHARVYNNTFINTDSGGCALAEVMLTVSDNIARNNLFSGVSETCAGSNVWGTRTHNHFASSTAFGTSTSTGAVTFTDTTNFDFTPTAPTTAGFTLAAPYNTDMFGNVRGLDGTWDRGAIEVCTSGCGGGGGPSPNIFAPARNLRVQP